MAVRNWLTVKSFQITAEKSLRALPQLLFYRFVLLEEDSAVQGHVLPVPQLHPGIVVILKVGREDALLGLAKHRVKPGIGGCLGGEIAYKWRKSKLGSYDIYESHK